MISDEGQKHAAHGMQQAAQQAATAIANLDSLTLRLEFLFKDGYGGNAIRLIELLERMQLPSKTGHPEDTCDRCGHNNICWFAPNDLWNRFHRSFDILCPTCFAEMAKLAGYDPVWKFSPQE